MKLRLRSLETKQTHKIEVPNTCNLRQLKEAINLQINPSSSSSIQHNLLLSLNRKEELFGSSNEDSLQSLGVTSGDLIYFTLNPNAFSLQTPDLSHVNLEINRGISVSNDQVVDLMNTHVVESVKFDELNDNKVEIGGLREEGLNSGNPRNDTGDLGKTQMVESSKDDELIDSSDGIRESIDTQVEGLSDYAEEKSIDLVEGGDEMEIDDENEIKGNFRYSVPSFLRKVFVKEVGDAAANAANGSDHKLLVIAVHAVLLESGFVGYDPFSGMKVDGFNLAEQWPSLVFGMTLHYTLPEVSSSEVGETVVLKFQSLGKYVNIYGSLLKKGYRVHRVCLDEPRFLPALSFIWKRSDDTNSENEMVDGSRKLYPNQDIFEFWKMVKDGLSYPLLIDLCDQLGLVPPPSFMRLPTELKLKILESLPAIDVARVECVCSELRFVALNNDLWRLKYEEEFRIVAASQKECQWKAKFSSAWETRKKRKRRMFVPLPFKEAPHFRPLFPGRRDPNLFGPPFVVGGDYDRLPGFGLPQHPGRRIFRRNCDLGGLGL